MAVVLHVTAEEGSRLWHGFAGQGRLCFQEGSGSKPEPYSVEVSRAYNASPDLGSVGAILIDDDYGVAVEELKVLENFFEAAVVVSRLLKVDKKVTSIPSSTYVAPFPYYYSSYGYLSAVIPLFTIQDRGRHDSMR